MKKIILLFLLCVAILLPSITSAQSILKQKQVVVWEIPIGINGSADLSEGMANEIRTTIINTFQEADGYTVYECNLDAIKIYVKAKGWQDTPKNRMRAVKEIYPEIDYIAYPVIKITSNSDVGINAKILIEVGLWSVEIGKLLRTSFVETVADLQAMPGACAQLLSKVLY